MLLFGILVGHGVISFASWQDETHQTVEQGLTFRECWGITGTALIKAMCHLQKKKEPAPKICIVSATLRDEIFLRQMSLWGIEQVSRWGIEVAHEIRATPREMPRRDIRIQV